jgi:hypothetical protein
MYKAIGVFWFLTLFLINSGYAQNIYITSEPFNNENIDKTYIEEEFGIGLSWWKREENGNIIKKFYHNIQGTNAIIITDGSDKILFYYSINTDTEKFPMNTEFNSIVYAEMVEPLYDSDRNMDILWFAARLYFWAPFIGKIDFHEKKMYLYPLQTEINVDNPIIDIAIDINNDMVYYSYFFEEEIDEEREYHLYQYDTKQNQTRTIKTAIGSNFNFHNEIDKILE